MNIATTMVIPNAIPNFPITLVANGSSMYITPHIPSLIIPLRASPLHPTYSPMIPSSCFRIFHAPIDIANFHNHFDGQAQHNLQDKCLRINQFKF